MNLSALTPIETQPIGPLARRIQASPDFAMELPRSDQVAQPERWNRRLRFILQAALYGELDDRGLVEAIPEVDDTPTIFTFRLLGSGLDQAYTPVMHEKVDEVHETESWQPFFKRLGTVLDQTPGWTKEPPQDKCKYLLSGQPSVVAHQVDRLATVVLKRGIRSEEQIAVIIRKGSAHVTRRQADRSLKAANLMAGDWGLGDVHKTLEIPQGTNELRFTRPIGQCPVGIEHLTVDEVDEQQRQEGAERNGCPVLKNSRIIEKLTGRVVDEALQRNLFVALGATG